MSSICEAIKKDGKRCTYNAKENSLCGMHERSKKLKEPPKDFKPRISLTFTYGMTENGIGMEQNGKLEKRGYTFKELKNMKNIYENEGVITELINLNKGLRKTDERCDIKAGVLIIRKAYKFMKVSHKKVFKEQFELKWDKRKYNLRTKKVNNSNARWNLTYGDKSQKPNYNLGKGRIVNFKNIPHTNKVREELMEIIPKIKAVDGGRKLLCEGNYYYDFECGIGFHGDGERKTVICFSLGGKTIMTWKWFQNKKPIGKEISIEINPGDCYIMSEKTIGSDWKKNKNNLLTLRHAAGNKKKYRTYKK